MPLRRCISIFALASSEILILSDAAGPRLLLRMCHSIPESFTSSEGNYTVEAVDATSGQVVAATNATDTSSLGLNTMSSSIDVTNRKYALGTREYNDKNLVRVYTYTETSVALQATCTTPNRTFVSASPGDVHCVAYNEGRLFVVDDAAFGKGIVSELTAGTDGSCTWVTKSSENQNRVAGSKNGPGGKCIGVPGDSKLVWLDDADNSKLVIYDYEKNTFFVHTLTLPTSTWTPRIEALGQGTIGILSEGKMTSVTNFDVTNSAAPTVSVSDLDFKPFDSAYIDRSTVPYSLVRADQAAVDLGGALGGLGGLLNSVTPESGSENGIFNSEDLKSTHSLPTLSGCRSGSAAVQRYDWKIGPASPGPTAGGGGVVLSSAPRTCAWFASLVASVAALRSLFTY